jgi:hypothetical protein
VLFRSVDGPPFHSLNDDLEEQRMKKKTTKRRLNALALRLSYHVTKTPQELMPDGQEDEDQAWSVMPDVPSSSPDYKPLSQHKTRDEAVRAQKKLEDNEVSEKLKEKQEEKIKPVEPVIKAKPGKELQPQTDEGFEAPKPAEPVIRAQPPEGMKPEEQAEDEPKKRGERTAGTKRRWLDVQEAAKEAWSRR